MTPGKLKSALSSAHPRARILEFCISAIAINLEKALRIVKVSGILRQDQLNLPLGNLCSVRIQRHWMKYSLNIKDYY